MKSHGSPTGLMELRLMEGSPTSPTTLRGGTSGTTQAGQDLWICETVVQAPRQSLFTDSLTTRGDITTADEERILR